MLEFFKTSYRKVKAALSKTRSILGDRVRTLFKGPWDESTFERLEQILFEADLGTQCSLEMVDSLKSYLKEYPAATHAEMIDFLKEEALSILEAPSKVAPTEKTVGPRIILIVGVNGSGKTTTIAKLTRLLQNEGKSVLLAAGDTFRAAAIEQLEVWAQRLNVPIVKGSPGGDPAAVAFDAVTSAKARSSDVVIIDTAGRLQNKRDLMEELAKVCRSIAKVEPTGPHETLLVLDATTGQNAIDQAEVFNSFTPLTGILLTKLDGSAKGGIALPITQRLGIPVRWIGVGEGMDDLLSFDPKSYVEALFE
jgi:fused signal recognition particle receptor